MIKNQRLWESWENGLIRKTKPDIAQNFRLLNAMYDEARSLGLFPPADPLQGLDFKIRWIKMINVSKAS